MALTHCPDCGHDVSNMAPACPHCARPLQPPPAGAVQTIEQTGKVYKAGKAIGEAGIALGVLVAWAGQAPTGGAVIMVLGLVVLLASAAGAWWDHA